ncbi:hypothetical protein [Streptacidiphilus fuscans]|uniref:Alanine-rich protein n=1 Tax=Streptacidiphilus fuscans TaxID=2789292 RepID=A0A931FCF4_9ACTN|nr:hypothetical protein [Streptacidiphilus fuscans]MBF9069677.1 hypothetical protein [Streptacidiphilus fuscans]
MSAATPAGAYLYPWDVVGDPGCAERVAELGVRRVAVAAAYHTVRALTPRHPDHRVVTADHSAVYYRLDPARWADADGLRPVAASWAPAGAFEQAAATLADAGLEVYGWVVLAHNQRLGSLRPDAAVVNAYGDRYPWALCTAAPAVRRYAATLAAETAALPHLSGLELESCGWYGFDHLHAHDKTSGVALPPAARLLFSLCFCGPCADAYAAHGADPDALRHAVRESLDGVFSGQARDATLPPELADVVRRMRIATATAFRAEVLDAVRAERPGLPVLLHTHPDPLAFGANPGAEPATLHATADGAVLQCPVRSPAALDAVRAQAAPGRRVVATVTALRGMGADLDDLPAWCADLVAAGATELRFYHAGLASAADLRAVRAAVAGVNP